MDNSVYVALSRQTALFREMDATANNIANVNTTGYTSEHTMFKDYLQGMGNDEQVAAVNDIGTYRNTMSGPLKQTGNPLDVAISGPGYFVIDTVQGERYSKAGSFTVNSEGNLSTHTGEFVLDDAGQPIQFEPNAGAITIGENGAIFVDNAEFATLGLVRFPNEQALQRVDGTKFRSDVAPIAANDDPEVRALQGLLEQSNVQPITEMTRMIEISRGVSSNAKFIESMYQLQRDMSRTYTQQ